MYRLLDTLPLYLYYELLIICTNIYTITQLGIIYMHNTYTLNICTYTNYMYNKLIYFIYYSTVTAVDFVYYKQQKFCEENIKESISLKNVLQLL